MSAKISAAQMRLLEAAALCVDGGVVLDDGRQRRSARLLEEARLGAVDRLIFRINEAGRAELERAKAKHEAKRGPT